MNVLTDYIGRCSHLEIIHLQFLRGSICMKKPNTFSRINTEEKWISNRKLAFKPLNILIEHIDSGLWIMPSRRIHQQVQLNGRNMIIPHSRYITPLITHTRVCKRCARLRRLAIDQNTRRITFRRYRIVTPFPIKISLSPVTMVSHCIKLCGSATVGKNFKVSCFNVYRKICRAQIFMCDSGSPT